MIIHSNEDIKELIESIYEHSNLSAWETDFLSSIEEQLDQGRTLTDKQVEKLQQIYEKAIDLDDSVCYADGEEFHRCEDYKV